MEPAILLAGNYLAGKLLGIDATPKNGKGCQEKQLKDLKTVPRLSTKSGSTKTVTWWPGNHMSISHTFNRSAVLLPLA